MQGHSRRPQDHAGTGRDECEAVGGTFGLLAFEHQCWDITQEYERTTVALERYPVFTFHDRVPLTQKWMTFRETQVQAHLPGTVGRIYNLSTAFHAQQFDFHWWMSKSLPDL